MRIGLRQRYALTIAVAAVAIASMVQFFSFQESIRLADEVERSSSKSMSLALRREADLAARQLAAVLTDSLIEPLVHEDFEQLFNITKSVRSLPHVIDIFVYDRDGTVIHDGTKEIRAYGVSAPENLKSHVIDRGETLTKFQDAMLDICVPISTANRIIGAVRFSTSLTGIKDHIARLNGELAAINQESADKHLRNFIGLIVVLLFLGTAVGIVAAGHLIRPIQDLTAMTRQIAGRNFNVNISTPRSDEVGELASSLRGMAAEIQESMISRSQLEKTVRERTIELESANKQLREHDHHRRRFLAEVSHELRTPLTIIHGEAQVTLRSDHHDISPYRDCLTTITGQTTTMRTQVDDLLTLARADHQLTEHSFGYVKIADIVRTASITAQKINSNNAIVIESTHEKEDLTIFGDEQKLLQLLLILIRNSVSYSPDGGAISICTYEGNDAVTIVITDQGIGLEPGDRQRIFDPFYRGANARQIFPSGSGLGLSIAKTIIDAHRGSICLSGAPDRGTTACLTLPLEGHA